MPVKPVPDGLTSVTPYLMVQGVPTLIEFMKRAFDGTEEHCTRTPDGKVMHAQVRVFGSPVMMGEAHGEWAPMPAAVHLYVPDTDATYRKAIDAGGVSVMEPADQFYGDRMAGVKDACGNFWWIATHMEDVSPEEIARRLEAMSKQRSGG